MGRNNRKYRKDLHQQAYEKLKQMLAIGESRSEGKKDGTARDRIYSFSTYKTYHKHIRYFLQYIKKHHPECTTLKAARRYVNEWLQSRVDQGLSNWTIHTESAALCKLYGIEPDDPKRFQPPSRHREEIKRSRVDVVRDKHFSETNNDELIRFCSATGCRRNVLEKLKGQDLWTREAIQAEAARMAKRESLTAKETARLHTLLEALEFFPDHTYFLWHHTDKGGRQRLAPIVGPDAELVVARMRDTAPGERVWLSVHSGADIHAYRAVYARRIYKMYARPINKIPYDRINKGSGYRYQSQVYHCQKDRKGEKLDKLAMAKVSKALGHNRLSVCADSYLRNL